MKKILQPSAVMGLLEFVNPLISQDKNQHSHYSLHKFSVQKVLRSYDLISIDEN